MANFKAVCCNYPFFRLRYITPDTGQSKRTLEYPMSHCLPRVNDPTNVHKIIESGEQPKGLITLRGTDGEILFMKINVDVFQSKYILVFGTLSGPESFESIFSSLLSAFLTFSFCFFWERFLYKEKRRRVFLSL
ncbi:hypothetical protein AAC387_Pa12g1667 [Persea americana]